MIVVSTTQGELILFNLNTSEIIHTLDLNQKDQTEKLSLKDIYLEWITHNSPIKLLTVGTDLKIHKI